MILIVDDEEDFRRVFRYHFEDLGFGVVEASNGNDALEVVATRAHEISLVATDIRMPQMNGEQLIRALRQKWPSLPIIGVTGHADIQDRLSALDEGAYYYLNKPLPPWPIVERLVDNAIRVYDYERRLAYKQQREGELARLVRAYILRGAGMRHDDHAQPPEQRFVLDVQVEPVAISKPGGDFVEWFERGGDEVIFYVADASGHDDVVACFMACLSSMILHRSHHRRRPPVEEIIMILDSAIQELREAGALEGSRYLTFFMGGIDLRTGRLTYVNATQLDAFLLRPTGEAGGGVECHRLRPHTRPVGIYLPAPREMAVAHADLRAGDLLFIYTDGACENLAQGAEELERVVSGLATEPAQLVVDRAAAYVKRALGARGVEDDTTLMAIRVSEAVPGG